MTNKDYKLESSALCPLRASAKDGRCEITPWNRKYTLDGSPFLSSIISGGEELLASPMRLVGLENGKEIIVTDVTSDTIYGYEEGKEVKACQYMRSSRFLYNTSLSAEYDGMMDWGLTIATHGNWVAQAFGLAKPDTDPRVLDRLWLEIPLKKSAAISYQYAPQGPALFDGKLPDMPVELYAAGAMPKQSLALPFVQQLYVGNDKAGFALFFESDKNWQVDDTRHAIECIVGEDEVEDTTAKIALAALKYGDLSNQPTKNYVFDMDKFAAFEGNTGPYILYTIVRIKSILSRYGAWEHLPIQLPANPYAKDLMLAITKFGPTMEAALKSSAPNLICAYIYELAGCVNKFYHETRILTEENEELKAGYIALIGLAKNILESCIHILGFEAPEKM